MDYSSSPSIPFEIPDISYGFMMAKGLLKLRETGLELEFEVTDSFLGVMGSGVETILLSYENLQEIQYVERWFSSKVILEGNSMKDFQNVPGSEQARCELKVKRKYRSKTKNIVSRARAMLSEHKLRNMDEQ